MNVLHVQPYLLLEWNFGVALDLPQAGEAGFHVQPLPFLQSVLRHFSRHRRAWTNQCQISEQDVQKLGHLIDAESPDEAPNSRNARILFHFEYDPVAGFILRCKFILQLVSVTHHGTEFVELEQAAILPNAGLSEENWPAILDNNGQANSK